MLKKQFLFPECYINKIPYCDKCKLRLQDNNLMIATEPPKWQYICPKCNEIYEFTSNELQGEWKWKTI